jgi:hypothetical protein
VVGDGEEWDAYGRGEDLDLTVSYFTGDGKSEVVEVEGRTSAAVSPPQM